MVKKKIAFAVAVVVLVVAGVVAAGWRYWPIHTTKATVLGALNDPGSAEFSDVIFLRRTGAGCGYVNAKNRMGGYVGRTMFVVSPNKIVYFQPNVNPETAPHDERVKLIDFFKLVEASCFDLPATS